MYLVQYRNTHQHWCVLLFLRAASSWVWGQRVHRGGAHWPCSLGGILNGSLWGKEHCRGGLHTRYGVHGKLMSAANSPEYCIPLHLRQFFPNLIFLLHCRSADNTVNTPPNIKTPNTSYRSPDLSVAVLLNSPLDRFRSWSVSSWRMCVAGEGRGEDTSSLPASLLP